MALRDTIALNLLEVRVKGEEISTGELPGGNVLRHTPLDCLVKRPFCRFAPSFRNNVFHPDWGGWMAG